MLLTIADFIGRFHPVLVHLPIGILLLACFFQLLTIKSRFSFLQPVIPVMLFWGMISAVASCISGYLLSQSGDYEGDLVGQHQWMGIFTAILSLVLYLLHKLSVGVITARIISFVLIILITITGHMGGSLTHGPGYLTEGLNNTVSSKGPALKPIADIQNAALYADVVQPLLQARCYSCHGVEKQKGKLRLDEPDRILKGGEEGKAVVAGKPDESKMIELLLLPADDKKHMPPIQKPQLTESEIKLLHWWVSSGADFTKKVKDIPQDDKIKPVLIALQSGGNAAAAKEQTDIPAKPVKAVSAGAIEKFTKANVMVIPVARNSNYISLNFVTASTNDSTIKLLSEVRQQLVWLKLDNAKLSDAAIDEIAKCTSLTRLQLSNSNITDKQLVKLQALDQLQSLNLVGTKITAQGILTLQKIKGLKNLYLYKTEVESKDWAALVKAFPQTQLDSGKYAVPILVTDTTIVTSLKN